MKPTYKNSDICPYFVDIDEKFFIIYTKKDTQIDSYPNIQSHLEKFREILESRGEHTRGETGWYALHRPRDEKLLNSNLCQSIENLYYSYILTPDVYFTFDFDIEYSALNMLNLLFKRLNGAIIQCWKIFSGTVPNLAPERSLSPFFTDGVNSHFSFDESA